MALAKAQLSEEKKESWYLNDTKVAYSLFRETHVNLQRDRISRAVGCSSVMQSMYVLSSNFIAFKKWRFFSSPFCLGWHLAKTQFKTDVWEEYYIQRQCMLIWSTKMEQQMGGKSAPRTKSNSIDNLGNFVNDVYSDVLLQEQLVLILFGRWISHD